MTPFTNDFSDIEYYEDIFEFAINAWNLANIKVLLPEEESDAAINLSNKEENVNVDLLNRMIDYKISHFEEYTSFMLDFELKETSGDPVLSVVTQEQDAYLTSMFENMEAENTKADFEENYINRIAIIIKPKQPFIDWCVNLLKDEEELDDADFEINTYLVDEDIKDVEQWLKKKFDKFFKIELENWCTNKKLWPQKRNYKMFSLWFRVEISEMIYDLEKKPILKFE
jgi:hypothetical protein